MPDRTEGEGVALCLDCLPVAETDCYPVCLGLPDQETKSLLGEIGNSRLHNCELVALRVDSLDSRIRHDLDVSMLELTGEFVVDLPQLILHDELGEVMRNLPKADL